MTFSIKKVKKNNSGKSEHLLSLNSLQNLLFILFPAEELHFWYLATFAMRGQFNLEKNIYNFLL